MRWPIPIALLIASLFGTGCATRQYELNLSEYPKLPSACTTHVLRAVVKSNRFMRTRALWGNYGGPGCAGGPPIDVLDRIFLEHDLAYLQGITRDELLEADRLLISKLEGLDPAELSPDADAFRQRTIRYFNRPIGRVVGKPPDVLFGWKTDPVVIDTAE